MAGASALALIILHQAFAVTTITVDSQSHSESIKKEAMRSVSSSLLQSDLLTFRSGPLIATLIASDPLIKDVAVTRHFPHSLTVNITLKQPSLGWSTGSQNYLLDRDGTIIGLLPAGSKLPVVVDGSNVPTDIGKRVANTHFVAFASAVAAGLSPLGLAPTGLHVQETTLDLYVTTNRGYQLIFDTSREAADELADLKTVLTNLNTLKRTPAEYIDLRVDGKAYYK